jgi:hypothetical protein
MRLRFRKTSGAYFRELPMIQPQREGDNVLTKKYASGYKEVAG